jgi:iron complex outermembrane receptor protein
MIRICQWLLLSAVFTASTAFAQPSLPLVRGTIVDAATSTPVAGATVSIVGQRPLVVTGTDGRFEIAAPAGTQVVLMTRDGYAPLTLDVTVDAARGATLDVEMPRQVSVTEGLTVVGRVNDYVDTSAGAARTSAALIDVPQAIVVLPARLIEDIGALDTKDLYKFMSGVSDSPYSSTVVRGFTQREVLVNGSRGNPYGSLEGDVNNSGFSTSQFRLSNLERIEVLKGPSSVLYGAAEPGGVINYVTKKPKDRLATRVMVGAGQFSQALTEAEITGPINRSRTLLGRAAVFFEDRDSFRTNGNTRNAHAVGNLLWRPNTKTSVTLEYEYIDQRNAAHRLRGVPVNAAGTFLADYRWTATEPDDYTDLQAHVAQVRLDQQVAGRLRLDSTFRWLSSNRDENYHEPRGITGSGTLMQREFRDQVRTNDDWSWNANLNAPFRTGSVRHDLSVGTEVVAQDFFFRFATARQQSAGGPVPPLALVSPVYGKTSPARYGLTPDRYFTDTAKTLRAGLYAQDLMYLTPKINLMLGGRVDRYDDEGQSGTTPLGFEGEAATGRAGLVFKPVTGLSLYGAVANGFVRAPILSQTPGANGPHDPETADQFEVGAKSEWLEGRLQLTTSAFSITKRNVLRPDPQFGPTGANGNAVLAVGKIRNRGFEIDAAGAILPRLNIAANYAYLRSEILDDLNAALVGKPMPNAAPHAVGLFARLDLPWQAALGAAAEVVGDRQEPFAGIAAPGYHTVDMQYTQTFASRVRLLIRCENLMDARYAASSLFAARAGNFPGQPRTVSVALTVTSR